MSDLRWNVDAAALLAYLFTNRLRDRGDFPACHAGSSASNYLCGMNDASPGQTCSFAAAAAAAVMPGAQPLKPMHNG